jgi:hypothetical protein
MAPARANPSRVKIYVGLGAALLLAIGLIVVPELLVERLEQNVSVESAAEPAVAATLEARTSAVSAGPTRAETEAQPEATSTETPTKATASATPTEANPEQSPAKTNEHVDEMSETIAPHRAQLRVVSPTEARVFVHGIDSGKTNVSLETACGARFVRLADNQGRFLEPGRMVVLKCGQLNQLELNPTNAKSGEPNRGSTSAP